MFECCFNTYIVYNLYKSSWQTLWLLHCASPSTWLLHVSRSSSPSGGWPSLSPAAAWSTPASWAGTPEPAGTGTGCPGTWPCGTAPHRAASSGSPPLHLSSSSELWRSRPSSPVAERRHPERRGWWDAGWSSPGLHWKQRWNWSLEVFAVKQWRAQTFWRAGVKRRAL